jgi:hypothetical protein
MSSLLVFNRVFRLEIQSVMLVFLTGIVNNCPLTFSLVSSLSPPLPLPCVNKYTVYTCKGGEYGVIGGGGRGLRQIKHLPQNPFIGKLFR